MKKGKAENLGILSTIRGINVPRFVVLRHGMSESEQDEIIRGFLKTCHGNTVAVRSSADQEDSSGASFAGMYTTKLRIQATEQAIHAAADEVRYSGVEKKEVVAHYAEQRGLELTESGVSVIVQEMIEAEMSGVIFSHDLAKADGYYAVSVSSGVGETIVGGAANGRLIRIARGIKPSNMKDAWLRKLIVAMKAIERRFRSSSLDVEFVVQDGMLYILQCRPITTAQAEMDKASEKLLIERIKSVNALVASRFRGDVLGDMIDINPVELLGIAPTPLDISIFKYLFADKIVERVRRDMGYDPLDIGVLRVVEGKPYVSMQAAAFSFRPRGISDEIYERMVRVYRNVLVNNSALQSRVEFDVFAMGCGEKLEGVMQEAQFNDGEKSIVRKAFLCIGEVFSRVSTAQAKNFSTFATDYEQRTASMGDTSLSAILEHVAHGTEMFARVARLAFYWKSRFEELHPREDLNILMSGHIRSVNERLQSDLVACRNGTIAREEVVERYGHLRPGQFSLFGESYADDPITYLFAQMERAEVTQSQRQAHAFGDTTEFRHIVTFMEARERMKFLFSRSLHLFATKLKCQLAQRGISECDASRVSWEELWTCLSDSTSLSVSQAEHEPPVLLPDVIIPGLINLEVVTFSEAMPSYITNSTVKARVCVLERLGVKVDVRGALVLLPNADPGYDFLFHSGAVGIITKVGGPASHMCIRSIELQMPACIGCGESVYQKLAAANSAVLDCGTRQIIVLD
ncbi:MAG: PEP/pyruvate-binding domain-containing protein [bacterium]|nr:PEP/pyruvate-binding domain-containing protein [bacterium]